MTTKTLLLIGLLLPIAASAQELQGNFGIKAGAALTSVKLTGTTANIPKQKLDYYGGVTYRLRYGRLTLQPELLFEEKGGTYERVKTGTVGDEQRDTDENHFNYLSLPVLFGYIPTEGLTLQVGPQFGYLTNPGSINSPGSRTDFGLAAGVHYDFLDALEKLSLHVRYVYGIQNVSTDATYKAYNRSFQVGIVYNFRKEK
jgi:hypothetical protein